VLRFWLRQSFGAAGWMIVIGLVTGALASIRVWLGLGGLLLGPDAANAYARLPSVRPPWLLAVAASVPQWLHWVIYFTLLGLVGTVGLVIGVLVRPKNRAADVAAGIITGLVFGVTLFTLSAGTLAVILAAVRPIEGDLRDLSRAAWAEPASAGRMRPRDGLLDKYPDLRAVPAQQRGDVFYQKIRTDLITGVPLGILAGELLLLAMGMLLMTGQVLAAGPLLRRHGASAAVVLPYFECVIPVILLLGLVASLIAAETLLRSLINFRPLLIWLLLLAALLVLAILSTQRQWPWPVRLLLHAGWIASEAVLVVLLSRGVLTVAP
jgi:hypothetical protein